MITSEEQAIIDQAHAIINRNLANDNVSFTQPEQVKEYAALQIGQSDSEQFLVMFVNNNNQLIKGEIMFNGTINSTTIHMREVAKRALELNAASVFLAHNHPSGNTDISEADVNLTRELAKVLGMFKINILDHVIVARETISMRRKGVEW